MSTVHNSINFARASARRSKIEIAPPLLQNGKQRRWGPYCHLPIKDPLSHGTTTRDEAHGTTTVTRVVRCLLVTYRNDTWRGSRQVVHHREPRRETRLVREARARKETPRVCEPTKSRRCAATPVSLGWMSSITEPVCLGWMRSITEPVCLGLISAHHH